MMLRESFAGKPPAAAGAAQRSSPLAQLELTLRKRFPPTGGAPGFGLDVTLQCESGITVLFGPSGSGKTMTLDALAGFLRPDAGRILLHNEILFDAESGVCLPAQRRGIGYVFQSEALFPHMTLEQNLAFGIHRLPTLERHRRIRQMLELFSLAELATRRPQELSGGQKQRASIARALITQPRLLLLDEPARGLDYPLRQELYEILRNVRQQYRIPILLVTHDVTEGYVLADLMAVFSEGRIIQTGSAEEVFLHPQNPIVARLLGIANIFTGTVEELDPAGDCSRIRTAGFSVTVPYLPGRLRGDAVTFCIAQEHVTLVPTETGRSTAPQENRIAVQVVEQIPTPNSMRLLLRVRAENDNAPAVQIESEVPRSAYKKLVGLADKQYFALLIRAYIHVFADQTK